MIVATTTPDFIFPATAVMVAAELGTTGKAAFDIEIACSGFIYGLAAGAGLVRSGVAKRVWSSAPRSFPRFSITKTARRR